MLKSVRWGIIGIGRFGAIHAQTVQSLYGSELAAVCHHDPEKLAAAASAYPETSATCDYRDLLQDNRVDAVSITTHWQQHFSIAKAALEAGKHVFLEKPMAETSEQCRELVALAADSPGFLMVGHVCRFDPRASLAERSIRDGAIGRIVSMHAKRNLPRAPGHIRLDKISPLMGDGIHDADLMLWFMNQMPTRVYARNVRASDFRYADVGWAMLEFGDAAVGVIETVWCLPENVSTVIDAKIEVIGTDGMLTVDCSETGFQMVNADGIKMRDTVYWPEQHGRRVGALAEQLAYFANCVRTNTAPTVSTPLDAAKAVTVMEAAERSAKLHSPVEIPSPDTDF